MISRMPHPEIEIGNDFKKWIIGKHKQILKIFSLLIFSKHKSKKLNKTKR